VVQERVGVHRLDLLRRGGDRGLGVARPVADEGLVGVEAGLQHLGDGRARHLGVPALVPHDGQHVERGLGLPPRVGHDCHRRVSDLQDVPDARHAGHTGGLVALHRAAEHRALLDRGVEHPRQPEVGAVHLGARHLGQRVEPLHRLADQLPVLRVLERHLCRRGELGGRLRDLAVRGRAPGGSMRDVKERRSSGALVIMAASLYASVSRPRVTIRQSNGQTLNQGGWIQVNRMGNPLFNEAFVALRDKDNLNRTSPTGDAAFATYAENPEVAVLINVAVFGDPTGAAPLATSGRADLRAVFIPEVLRVDTTTPPVRLAGQVLFNRLGFIGGDTTTDSAGRVKSSGWPNGRRLGDDVCDIGLTAVANGPAYAAPVLPLGDNVNANDQVYNQVFPYSGTPHSGTVNRKDPS
jgi:hypothetical protein